MPENKNMVKTVTMHDDYWKTIIKFMEKSTDKEIRMLSGEIRSQTGLNTTAGKHGYAPNFVD